MPIITTRAQWASALLGALGFPDSKTNVQNIVGWETKEGGAGPQFGVPNNDDNYNPISVSGFAPGSVFNESGQYPGVKATNSSGIDSFTSWQQGIDATAEFLQSPDNGYPEILNALSDSAPWATFSAAVSDSKGWPNDLDYSTPPGSGADVNPNGPAYTIGSNATVDNGSVANDPSSKNTEINLSGMAGILQQMDQWFNPTGKGGWSLDPLTDIDNITSNVTNTVVMVASRLMTGVIAIGFILVGIKTITGGSSGNSGGAGNVLEFVNDAKIQNTKVAQSAQRINERDLDRQSRERIASTPKTIERHSVIEHKTTRKPRVKVKLVPIDDYLS